jgi:hypothetical protein
VAGSTWETAVEKLSAWGLWSGRSDSSTPRQGIREFLELLLDTNLNIAIWDRGSITELVKLYIQ